MRVNGRVLRPSTLAERRLFCSLGTTSIKVPRSYNPYVIARRAKRLAENQTPDFLMLKELVAKYHPHEPTPDVDTSEPPDAMVDGVTP